MVDSSPTLYTLASDAGVSQRAIAAALNTDVSRVKRWLHHLQPLPAAVVLPLAGILDIPAENILKVCHWTPSHYQNAGARKGVSGGRSKGATKTVITARITARRYSTPQPEAPTSW